jgi:hypothetical protein
VLIPISPLLAMKPLLYFVTYVHCFKSCNLIELEEEFEWHYILEFVEITKVL